MAVAKWPKIICKTFFRLEKPVFVRALQERHGSSEVSAHKAQLIFITCNSPLNWRPAREGLVARASRFQRGFSTQGSINIHHLLFSLNWRPAREGLNDLVGILFEAFALPVWLTFPDSSTILADVTDRNKSYCTRMHLKITETIY